MGAVDLLSQILYSWANGQMNRKPHRHAEMHSEFETGQKFIYFTLLLKLASVRFKGIGRKFNFNIL